ncbi:hypothetical protein C4565_01575 [Candidatus Parcubacteria bacterium]|nr:MAG: hypothetical protein C4565_01575 [Candidatus Parcubacteria bacterium]
MKGVGVEIRLGVEVGARLGVGGIAAVEEDLPQNGREGRERRISFGRDRRRDDPAFMIGHVRCHIGNEYKRSIDHMEGLYCLMIPIGTKDEAACRLFRGSLCKAIRKDSVR